MKEFSLEDIGKLADRVIELNHNMQVTFDNTPDREILRLAIMVGLNDAYGAGIFDQKERMKANIKIVKHTKQITKLNK